MRQFSERFSSCRTQQEYTQVGIRIFRFFRMEGSNHFPDRRRIPACEARHGNPIDSRCSGSLKKRLVHIIIGRNRDVREAFLRIGFEEPGRPIGHLFQTDFTEIMLLLRDGLLIFHTFPRLYNGRQMFFGGASSKATPRPTRHNRVGLGVLWVERAGTALNYPLLHEAVRLLLQLSDETE